MKYKKIYNIWFNAKWGTGVQPVKGDNKKQAKQRFKKRYPKYKILDIGESYNALIAPL